MANNPITPTKVNFATGDVLTAQQMDDLASSVNRIAAYATTATAAGTTTLTVTDAKLQRFTGSTTQTVLLPVTSTLGLGMAFVIQNESSGIVTVQSSGANTVYAVPAGATATFTCILTSGTTAASWSYRWDGATAAPGTSAGLNKVVSATFSSVAAVNVNNCFSSTYSRYRILIKILNSSNVVAYMKMRVGGVDNSGAIYYWSGAQVPTSGATVNNQGAGATSGFNIIKTNTSNYSSVIVDVFYPFQAINTNIAYIGQSVDSGWNEAGGGWHVTNTSYDGFSLVIASGSTTGEYTVYGYAD